MGESRLKLFFKAAGPGLVTGAADDDPSGIGTYSQAGAQFGFQFLYAAVLTWPLMATVQMACARVGMVTGEGLASAFEKKIPKWLLLIFCLALFVANTLNVAADLLAMADGVEMLGAGASQIWVVIFGVGIGFATVKFNYRTIARALQWLAVVLLAYIVTAFIIKINWSEAIHATFVPRLPHGSKEWSMLVAILGTTISPYLFFWQTAQEVEERKGQKGCTEEELFFRRVDVGAGTLLSNLVMFFIILVAASTLNAHGVTDIETTKQAAEALKPIAGNLATLLYTIGLIGTGLLAIPTLTGSAAYALAETLGWDEGLDSKWGEAKAFYSVILVSLAIGIIADFANVNPIKALVGSAVVNGVVAPFILLVLWFVIRDPHIMGKQTAPRRMQILLALCALLMFGALFGLVLF